MKNNEKSKFKKFINDYLVPKGILLFHSPYLGDDDQILTLPLKTKRPDNFENFFCCTSDCKYLTASQEDDYQGMCAYMVNWYLRKTENEGSEEFLEKARDILIEERSRKVEERRRKNMKHRKSQRREQKAAMRTRIERIEAQISNISNKST